MALAGIEKTLCNKMVTDFNSIMGPGLGAKNEINKRTNKLKADLHGLVYSPNAQLNQALYDFQANVNLNLPGNSMDDLYRLKNFMDKCLHFDGISSVSAMLGSLFGLYDKIQNLVGDYNNLFPEFEIGNLASGIDGLLKSLNIKSLLGSADNLLDCLDSGCATFDPEYTGDLSNMTDQLDGLYNDLNLVSDSNSSRYGLTDFQNTYQSVGMTSSEIIQMETVRNNMDLAQIKAETSINNTVDAIKNEIKFGDLFA